MVPFYLFFFWGGVPLPKKRETKPKEVGTHYFNLFTGGPSLDSLLEAPASAFLLSFIFFWGGVPPSLVWRWVGAIEHLEVSLKL